MLYAKSSLLNSAHLKGNVDTTYQCPAIDPAQIVEDFIRDPQEGPTGLGQTKRVAQSEAIQSQAGTRTVPGAVLEPGGRYWDSDSEEEDERRPEDGPNVGPWNRRLSQELPVPPDYDSMSDFDDDEEILKVAHALAGHLSRPLHADFVGANLGRASTKEVAKAIPSEDLSLLSPPGRPSFSLFAQNPIWGSVETARNLLGQARELICGALPRPEDLQAPPQPLIDPINEDLSPVPVTDEAEGSPEGPTVQTRDGSISATREGPPAWGSSPPAGPKGSMSTMDFPARVLTAPPMDLVSPNQPHADVLSVLSTFVASAKREGMGPVAMQLVPVLSAERTGCPQAEFYDVKRNVMDDAMRNALAELKW